MAGIVVAEVRPQRLSAEISAPGEVVQNAYATSKVTPRIPAQVLERHARLGDKVQLAEPLVSLTSVEMAAAQGDLLVATREWQRVSKLGQPVVSEKRFVQARVSYQQAKSRVSAYGMSEQQLAEFLRSRDPAKANGRFQLLATQPGTVLADRFIVGELIQPGTTLYTISNESLLWVEAKLTPLEAQWVRVGSVATVRTSGRTFTGRVVQVHHALDRATRTLGVRIELANIDDQLHAGLFVQVSIHSIKSTHGLFVPLNAVLRSADGDWQVFVEKQAGEFAPVEVALLQTIGNMAQISGVEAGTRLVTNGAFFVQSELAKAGFEVHNH
ncbi:efflux transporter periplasmic adaptor subunit [Cycloclasticus sp. 46_120_T64]|nr:efflux transporter periplasmic adaptor subunit [Cycloclasticus sp. 46_120_T64]